LIARSGSFKTANASSCRGARGKLGDDRVAPPARFVERACPERKSLPFGGSVGTVEGEMVPPRAVVIPQVVERIAAVDADGQGDGVLHDAFDLWLIAG